ncbi:MAG: hypothetical protein WBG23_01680, partial [Acidobacteriaceae bacterium]
MQSFLAPIRFGCNALRGNWLRPWRSPYLRWRIETYSGIPASTIDARIFWRFFFTEKGNLLHFLLWTAKLESY